MDPIPFGISRIEVRLPRGRMTVEEMAARSGVPRERLLDEVGVERKPVLSPDESIVDLAVAAAQATIEGAGIAPRAIDLILFCSCGISERALWSPAARVQKEIGASEAFSFDVMNGCHSGNLGLHLASSLLRAQPSRTTALVVIADALSGLVDYRDPAQSCLYNFSDGASAVLVRKGERANQLLSFQASTCAAFADHMYIPRGSAFIHMNTDEAEDRALSTAYQERYAGMIRGALDQAGLRVADVDHLFMNQGDHRLIRKLTGELAMAPEKIVRSYRSYGHLGGTDVFFGWKTRLDEGTINPGHVLVLASSAIGFSWGATVIRA